jgi:hypothetical protein
MSTPLAAALDAVDKYIKTNSGYPQAQTIKARVRAMLRAYDKHWAVDNQRYQVIGVEKLLLGPIVNLTNKKDSGYQAGGKLDVRLRDIQRNQTLILDHKFLSGEMDESDIEHLTFDGQLNQYIYLEHVNGVRVDGAIWDVLAKTSHRLHKETKNKPAETVQEFEERLFALYTEEPTKFFARIRLPMNKHNVIEHVTELYDWTQMIDSSKASGKHLRNTESCFQYQRPCKYLGICSGKSDMDDRAVWTTTRQMHAELELPAGVDPTRVVTNSRLKVFKTCHKKHHLSYNLGLRKANEVTEEPLFLGSCGHSALEMYFVEIQNQQRKAS